MTWSHTLFRHFVFLLATGKGVWGLLGSFHAFPLLAHLLLILARMARMAKLKDIDVNHLALQRLERCIK